MIDPFPEDEGDLGLWPPPERTWDQWLQMSWQERSRPVETVDLRDGRL